MSRPKRDGLASGGRREAREIFQCIPRQRRHRPPAFLAVACPVSSVSNSDNSRLRARMICAARCRMRPRSTGGARGPVGLAHSAAAAKSLFNNRGRGRMQLRNHLARGGVMAVKQLARVIFNIATANEMALALGCAFMGAPPSIAASSQTCTCSQYGGCCPALRCQGPRIDRPRRS